MNEYIITAATDIGNVRGINQDNFLCNGACKSDMNKEKDVFTDKVGEKDRLLVAVFDGMGGLDNGELAAYIACEITNRYGWMQQESPECIIKRINNRMCEESELSGKQLGSTCVFLEYSDGRFRSWNLGDSRAYWLHDGKLMQISYDHTERNTFEEVAQRAGLEIDTDTLSRNTLTQHLGVAEDDFVLEPYKSEWIMPEAGDAVLLCSDGLTEMLSDTEIQKILTETEQGFQKSLNLKNAAKEKGGKDNITVLNIDVAVR